MLGHDYPVLKQLLKSFYLGRLLLHLVFVEVRLRWFGGRYHVLLVSILDETHLDHLRGLLSLVLTHEHIHPVWIERRLFLVVSWCKRVDI